MGGGAALWMALTRPDVWAAAGAGLRRGDAG